MKFGKLPDISHVDFSLPADNQHFSTLPASKSDTTYHIGATGWSMKDWVGRIYPKSSKAKEFLYHYSRQFSTIELNTTHYRIPTEDNIEQWKAQSAADFRFCPKLPQSISHSRELDAGDQYLSLFCERIAALDEKLGCCFIQLPPYFDSSRLPVLEAFLKRFPTDIPLAVELRHESWFQPNNHNWIDLLQQYNRTAVITDVAGRRDVLHMALTNATTMIRFVGNNLHPTDYERTADWADRLVKWSTMGLRDAYIFTHEPDNYFAPELAAHFAKVLQQQTGQPIKGPVFIEQTEGEQMKLF